MSTSRDDDVRTGRRRRRAATLATAFASVLLLAGCAGSGSSSDALTVYNWGSADEAKVYDSVFTEFGAANGVTVEDNVVPVNAWGDYVSKLATQVASGNSPDLLNMAMEGTRLSEDKGLLTPLDEYLSESELAERLDSVPEVLKDAYTVDGKLYEIPNGYQTMVIYANTDLFTEKGVPLPDPDWTWDDFLATAQALNGDDVKGFGLPWGFFQMQPWLSSNGASLVSDDLSAPTLTDPAVVESVTFIRDLVQTYEVSPDPTNIDVYSQFSAGKFGMIAAGRWPIPAWSSSGFDSYVALPWPKMTSHTTVVGGSGWAISAKSENKDAAWKAIEALMDPETITSISDIGQQIPIFPGTATPTGDKAADDALAFLETAPDDAKPVPAPPWFDTLESVTMRYMSQIVTGQLEPEDGLQQAQDEIEAAIE